MGRLQSRNLSDCYELAFIYVTEFTCEYSSLQCYSFLIFGAPPAKFLQLIKYVNIYIFALQTANPCSVWTSPNESEKHNIKSIKNIDKINCSILNLQTCYLYNRFCNLLPRIRLEQLNRSFSLSETGPTGETRSSDAFEVLFNFNASRHLNEFNVEYQFLNFQKRSNPENRPENEHTRYLPHTL